MPLPELRLGVRIQSAGTSSVPGCEKEPMSSSVRAVNSDDAERVKNLLEYEILDTLPDPAFDEIARLAGSICGAPYAFIGLVDWSRVWFKSRIGFSSRQIARNGSACQFVVMEGRPTVINDAAADRRFPPRGIALDQDIYCRSYAAAPLVSPSGAVIGALSVAGAQPSMFNQSCLEPLQILARQVVTRLELYSKNNDQERVLRSRQRTERALTVERNFVSAVLNTISALVLVLDTAGRIVRFNRASESTSGYALGDLAGRVFPEELFPPEDRECAVQLFERARSGKSGAAREVNWRSKTGQLRRISWTATSLTNAQGEISFIIMTGIDLTAQRAAEAALGTSETRYRQLVENSLGMVTTQDLRGTLLSINAHAAASLGYEPEEMTGTPLSDYIDEQHRDEYDRYLESIARDRECEGRFHFKRKDGGVAIVAYRNRLLDLPGSEPFILGYGIDITRQTQAQDELNALMSQHESILEAAGDGIWGMDLEGRLTFINRSGAEMFGYTPQEVQGLQMHALVHHSHPDGSPYSLGQCPIVSGLKNEEPVYVNDDVFWRKDGSSFPVEYAARPLVHGGRITGAVVAFADVSERRRLERMKDEFISTVSHELRTPLTSLRASLGLIAGGVLEKRPEKTSQMLEIAVGNCDRLVRLVNNIVDFDRIGSGRMPLSLGNWDTLELLRRAVDAERSSAARAGLTFYVDAQSAQVWIDGELILQALGNLIQNAIKFSERGGQIRLAASVTNEKEVTFEVQDHGRGILPENLQLIFDRFQQGDASDSRAAGGAGLGLAICRSIIERHGGRIWVKSTPGEGSSFFFTVERSSPDGESEGQSADTQLTNRAEDEGDLGLS